MRLRNHRSELIDAGRRLPINANTDPGDLVILPFVGVALRPVAEQIYNGGRSLLAIAHNNPGSSSALGGSTMSLPTGATVNPT